MRAGFLRLMAFVVVCVTVPGCLQNSVQRVTDTRRAHPDSAHSIVIVGVGLEAAWPFAAFSLALDEYSFEKHDITGNCFRYNHIEATRASNPAKVTYFAYRVPAGTYVFKLLDSNDPTLVAIFNEDGSHLITTVQGIPSVRTETPDKAILQLEERPSCQPEALKAWFYPGYNFGVEFVYPTQK